MSFPELLARRGEARRAKLSDALVELKVGGPSNLFLVHDGDGNTDVYRALSKRMPSDLSVFGITPTAIAGVPLAHTQIEDMASSYIARIRGRQAHGPYILGGLCAGGVVAYEMASQLLSLGEPVQLVLVLEAATPQATKRQGLAKQRFGRLRQEVAKLAKAERSPVDRATSILAVTSKKLLNTLSWEVVDRGQRLWVRLRFGLLRHLLVRQRPWPRCLPKLTVRQIYESAVSDYRPNPLRSGSLAVVRAQHRTPSSSDTPYSMIYSDQALGWAELAQDLTFVDAAGGHSTMLEEPFVRSLAAKLVLLLPPYRIDFEVPSAMD